MTRTLLSFVGLQAGWFACVLGAAGGHPWIGVAVVSLLAGVQLTMAANPVRLFWTLAGAALLGVGFDGGLTTAGVLQFSPAAAVGWPVPVWMVALWVNLALALPALAWLTPRPLTSGAIGAASGVLSYLAGARLDAVVLTPRESVALGLVALEWAIALPLLLLWSGRRRREGTP